MRLVGWLVAIGLAGCVEVSDSARISPVLIEAVHVSRAEPAGQCRALGALDGTCGDCDNASYESAYGSLRANAALRGGNYVVIDLITVHRPGNEDGIAIHGRVYSCPLGALYPTQVVRYARPIDEPQ
jgi:hypothetical protein